MAAYQYVYHMDGVSKTYPGGKKCFENIRLSFLPGVKIGVVGVNGAGKSTLLKIMAGLDTDFSGEAWAAEGAKVGYLPQEPKLEEGLTVRENVMLGVKAKKDILDRYNDLAMNYSDETADEMAQLQDEIDANNLWDLDAQIDVSMEALRCPPDDAMPENLSGGEARRVALCRLLLEQPDMLLLDEPTNHLDAETIAWLQKHLIDYTGTILVVTHDRYFLDDITGWILEIDRGQGVPYEGTVDYGDTVQLSYVDQSRDDLDPNANVWEAIADGLDVVQLGDVEVNGRAYCSAFNFKGATQQKKVSLLSGGERNRVHMARLLRAGGNVLLLDEPTNDLDVETLRALEDALVDFAGCAVVISHDRFFLDRICTHILAFEGDAHVEWFEGNFEDYEEDKKRRLGADALQPTRIKHKKFAR